MNPQETKNKGFISYQLQTFIYAFRGIRVFFTYETKAVIHLLASALAIVLGVFFKLDKLEWTFIVVAIGIVFISELFNTVVEKLADLVEPEMSTKVKDIKDIAAGAVLVSAITSLIIGLLIYIPKIAELIIN